MKKCFFQKTKFLSILFIIIFFFLLFSSKFFAQGNNSSQGNNNCSCPAESANKTFTATIPHDTTISMPMCFIKKEINKINKYIPTSLPQETWKCNNGTLTLTGNQCDNGQESEKYYRFPNPCAIDTNNLSYSTKVTSQNICLGYLRPLYSSFQLSPSGDGLNISKLPSSKFELTAEIQKDILNTYIACLKCYNVKVSDDNNNNMNQRNSEVELDKTSSTIWTEAGCLYVNLQGSAAVGQNNTFYTSIARIFYALSLLAVLIRIILSGYTLMNSQDTGQLKEAKEQIFGVITATIFFSLGMIGLAYVGIDVLGLKDLNLPIFI